MWAGRHRYNPCWATLRKSSRGGVSQLRNEVDVHSHSLSSVLCGHPCRETAVPFDVSVASAVKWSAAPADDRERDDAANGLSGQGRQGECDAAYDHGRVDGARGRDERCLGLAAWTRLRSQLQKNRCWPIKRIEPTSPGGDDSGSAIRAGLFRLDSFPRRPNQLVAVHHFCHQSVPCGPKRGAFHGRSDPECSCGEVSKFLAVNGLAALQFQLGETAIVQLRRERSRQLRRPRGKEYLLRFRHPLDARTNRDVCSSRRGWVVHLPLATRRHFGRFTRQRKDGLRANRPHAGAADWGSSTCESAWSMGVR